MPTFRVPSTLTSWQAACTSLIITWLEPRIRDLPLAPAMQMKKRKKERIYDLGKCFRANAAGQQLFAIHQQARSPEELEYRLGDWYLEFMENFHVRKRNDRYLVLAYGTLHLKLTEELGSTDRELSATFTPAVATSKGTPTSSRWSRRLIDYWSGTGRDEERGRN